MPNLLRLKRRGVFIKVLPVLPTHTPTSWITISTGAWLGTHGITGIFSLILRIEDSQILRLYGDRVWGVIFTRGRTCRGGRGVCLHTARYGLSSLNTFIVRTLFKEGLRVEEDCMAYGYSSHYSLPSGIPTSQGLWGSSTFRGFWWRLYKMYFPRIT